MTHERNLPDAGVVLELIGGFRRSKLMFAAVELGVFDKLSRVALNALELAGLLDCHPDALARLLNALVGLQLLQKEGELFSNTPAAEEYLTSRSPNRLAGYIRYSNATLWKLWGELESAIREGGHRWKQVYGWDGPIFASLFHTEDARREFLMGMHGFGVLSSPHVVRAFDLTAYKRMADLGAATGHLVMAACEQYPHLQGVIFDLPHALDLAREITSVHPCKDRMEIQAGDFFNDPLPDADLYALGRILHDWSEDKIEALLRKIQQALPRGGALLIAEKVLDEKKTAPDWALLQDINMLICTEGRERTYAEYQALLLKAGFTQVTLRQTSAPIDALLAVK